MLRLLGYPILLLLSPTRYSAPLSDDNFNIAGSFVFPNELGISGFASAGHRTKTYSLESSRDLGAAEIGEWIVIYNIFIYFSLLLLKHNWERDSAAFIQKIQISQTWNVLVVEAFNARPPIKRVFMGFDQKKIMLVRLELDPTYAEYFSKILADVPGLELEQKPVISQCIRWKIF